MYNGRNFSIIHKICTMGVAFTGQFFFDSLLNIDGNTYYPFGNNRPICLVSA